LLFAETEEIEVGGVAEVEKLEMILPSFVTKLYRAVVIFQELVGIVQAVSSKGGLIAMTRGLARELGDHGVTVNAVAPGFTLTDASRRVVDNAETWSVDRGAIRRAERPEDLVGAVLWLASPHSDFVTGQTLIVDGGRQFH
jgi:NAD(P)-dependent dehydrogenase (short-subunit alcohol dehydrogenase family)